MARGRQDDNHDADGRSPLCSPLKVEEERQVMTQDVDDRSHKGFPLRWQKSGKDFFQEVDHASGFSNSQDTAVVLFAVLSSCCLDNFCCSCGAHAAILAIKIILTAARSASVHSAVLSPEKRDCRVAIVDKTSFPCRCHYCCPSRDAQIHTKRR